MFHLLFALFAPAAALVAAPAAEFPPPEGDAEFFAAFRARVIGEAPAPVPADPRIEASEQCDGYTLQTVSYNVEVDERVRGYLLIPDHRPGARLPLVFCLHPTARHGKDMVIGRNPATNSPVQARKYANRAYALDLVRRGFVCFAPDRIGFGERAPHPDEPRVAVNMRSSQQAFDARHPDWRLAFGKVPYDLSRALDFLSRLDFVDAERVGVIGHSLGAWDAILFYGSDPRVGAAVSNSGGAHSIDKSFWTDRRSGLAFAEGKLQVKPNTESVVQFFIMMGAPRPLLYIRGIKDEGTDYASSPLENIRLIDRYFKRFSPNPHERFGKPQFAAFFHGEGHDFPPYARELAGAWLEVQLKPDRQTTER